MPFRHLTKGKPMESTAELIGFFAAHGIWSVSDGGPLIPMLAYELPNGERGMDRFMAEQLEEAVGLAQQALENNEKGATRAVAVFDALITLDDGKTDALILQARKYSEPECRLEMAVPYRTPDSPEGFAVHKPKFLSVEGGDVDYSQLAVAFFNGVDSHEEAAKVWNAHLDESR
jgi:hypothetical protein